MLMYRTAKMTATPMAKPERSKTNNVKMLWSASSMIESFQLVFNVLGGLLDVATPFDIRHAR
jgi:hypothetical protein